METPRRSSNKLNTGDIKGYSPIILPESPAASPQRNLTGLPRVAKDICADIYNNIQKWNDNHIKGAAIVKQIAILKSDNIKTYSAELEEQINMLYDIVQELGKYRKALELSHNQASALIKLQKENVPLFISLTVKEIVDVIHDIIVAYKLEYKVKETVLENIAHSKSKDEVMFFAVMWSYQQHISDSINLKLEALLLETGHRLIK